MDNVNSQPQIRVPLIPVNFESLAGMTKTQFAQAILDIVARSLITGVTPGVADVASLQQRATVLEQEMAQAQEQIVDLQTRVTDLENP